MAAENYRETIRGQPLHEAGRHLARSGGRGIRQSETGLIRQRGSGHRVSTGRTIQDESFS